MEEEFLNNYLREVEPATIKSALYLALLTSLAIPPSGMWKALFLLHKD